MEKVNEVFFSEKGLTSTSASHLADLAQKTVLGNEAKLKNMSFITTKVDIVGSLSESGKTVSLGYDEKGLSEVKGLLEEIAEMNAFCAWMVLSKLLPLWLHCNESGTCLCTLISAL